MVIGQGSHQASPLPPSLVLSTPDQFLSNHLNHQAMVKSFEVCDLPVRCAKFVVRKSWFVAASDDMFLRVSITNCLLLSLRSFVRFDCRNRGRLL